MSYEKTKSIQKLEDKLASIEPEGIRRKVLESAKGFKTSWIDLAQSLYSVWKDKLYKDWGYNKFDAYTSKEIGIRKQTALKLLKSYYFLEKEDVRFLSSEHNQNAETASLPTYESVDALRLASNKKELDKVDYAQIKKNVLEKGKDAPSVRKDLTALMRQREELLPEEAWRKKRLTLLKRSLSLLKSLKQEIKLAKMFDAQVLKDLDAIISKLEIQLP